MEKIHAACDARRDDDFVIIGRTDALAVAGWGEVEDRVGRYREAGADLVFVDGIPFGAGSARVCPAGRRPGLPALYNGVRPARQIEDLGFRVQIVAGASLGAVAAGLWRTYGELYQNGALPSDDGKSSMPIFPRLLEVLGLPDIYAKEARYQVTGDS